MRRAGGRDDAQGDHGDFLPHDPGRAGTDKGASLYLDALWAIQAVSPPARFDGSVTRTDPSFGRRCPGTGRARSLHRLRAGRPAIGLERRPTGVGSGNWVRIRRLGPAGFATGPARVGIEPDSVSVHRFGRATRTFRGRRLPSSSPSGSARRTALVPVRAGCALAVPPGRVRGHSGPDRPARSARPREPFNLHPDPDPTGGGQRRRRDLQGRREHRGRRGGSHRRPNWRDHGHRRRAASNKTRLPG